MGSKVKNQGKLKLKDGTPNGIRIRVGGLKGRCPRPLDDGGTTLTVYQRSVSPTTSNKRETSGQRRLLSKVNI